MTFKKKKNLPALAKKVWNFIMSSENARHVTVAIDIVIYSHI